MTKDELFSVLMNQRQAAEEIHGMLSERYTLSYLAYRGEFPTKGEPNDISAARVMWQAFESIYPSLVELFTSSQRSPVSFDSDTATDGKLAAAITRAIHGSALKIDGYYRLMMEAIKEILITGDQAARVGYEEKHYESDKQNFTDAPVEQIAVAANMLMKMGYKIDHELEFNESERTGSGWIQGKRTIKYPVINLIDFRNFYLHPKAVDVASSPYTAYREDITVAEGVEAGYSESKLLNAGKKDLDDPAGESKQLIVIGDMNGDIDSLDADYSEYNQTVTLYHH